MAELSGTPAVRAIREMMRNQEILDKMRDIYEVALARSEVSQQEFDEKIAIIESVEREMAKDDEAP